MDAQKRPPLLGDGRVDQRLQGPQLRLVAKHRFRQSHAVDSCRACGSGKARLDRCNQRSPRTLQPMNRGIGIEHRHAFFLEHTRHGRLPHADRSGEAKHDHDVSSARSSASCSRGAGI